MSNQKKSILFAIAAILFWSTVGTAFKITLRHLNYAEMLLLSSFVSVIFLGILIISNKQVKLLKQTTVSQLGYSALLGFLNPFAYYIILFKAYSILRAQEAVALNYIWPMMLVLLSVPILKQKIKFLSVVALLISFSGAIIIASQGKPFSLDLREPFGVALALSSAIFWALFWLLNIRDNREETLKLFMNFLFGFFYTLIYCLLTGNIHIPPMEGALGAVYIGLFEMGITFVFWLKALKYAENTAKVSNLVYLSPFISLLFISVIIGEKILASTLAGLVLIITGIILQQLISSRKTKTGL
jgi:drug/metabolite transporter (DMT)-like permease